MHIKDTQNSVFEIWTIEITKFTEQQIAQFQFP